MPTWAWVEVQRDDAAVKRGTRRASHGQCMRGIEVGPTGTCPLLVFPRSSTVLFDICVWWLQTEKLTFGFINPCTKLNFRAVWMQINGQRWRDACRVAHWATLWSSFFRAHITSQRPGSQSLTDHLDARISGHIIFRPTIYDRTNGISWLQ